MGVNISSEDPGQSPDEGTLPPDSDATEAVNEIAQSARARRAGITPEMIKAAAECGASIFQIGDNVTVIPPEDPYTPPPHEQTTPFLKHLFRPFFVLGVLSILAGIVLVAMKSDGTSELSFFGQHLTSKNAGVVAIFIGCALLLLALRRILSTYDRIVGSPSSPPQKKKNR